MSPETRGTEQRIAHGVRHRIGITVSGEPALACKRDSGEHERALVVGEAMHVETLADTHSVHRRLPIARVAITVHRVAAREPTRDRRAS